MARSPGHRKWPDHKVEEQHLKERMQVEAVGRVLADSAHVIRVVEDEQPDRLYFPRAAIDMSRLEASGTTTKCPFKGTARYYSVNIADQHLDDAAWSYEEPYEEHAALRGRIAFHDDKRRELKIKPVIPAPPG